MKMHACIDQKHICKMKMHACIMKIHVCRAFLGLYLLEEISYTYKIFILLLL